MTAFEASNRARANRLMACLLLAHIPVLFVFALVVGSNPAVALFGSLLLCAVPTLMAFQYPSQESTSIAIGAAMMGCSGLLIYLGNGRIEYHFHVFSFLAVLTAMGSYKTQIVAAATIAIHHLGGWFFFPRAVFNYDAAFLDVVLHAFFVIIETVILCWIAHTYRHTIHTRGILEEQLAVSAKQLAVGSSEIAKFVEQFALSVAQQAEIVDLVAATGAELERGMADRLTEVRQASEDFATSRQTIGSAQMELESVNEQIGETAEESRKISSIVLVMDDIARQISLLAVNASIEASRSGAGSGFGVIADQVRDLAERTSSATRQIEDLVQRSTDRLASGSSALNHVAGSYREVTAVAANVSRLFADLTQTTSQQSTSLRQIAESMQRISRDTQTFAAGTQQTASTSQELAQLAKQFESILAEVA